jgi:hypothetical protein
MLRLANEPESFKTILDRNGIKIHIGEQALIIEKSKYLKCQVVAFSANYKYVYLVSNEIIFKRNPNNIVLIHNLKNWKN